MSKTFLQFNKQINEWIGIEKEEEDDPFNPKPKRRTDVSPERYMYDRSLDPADTGDTKKRGFLTHLAGAAKGMLKKVGREFVASAGEAIGGNIGRELVKNAYTAKDIDKHRDIRVQQIKTHQLKGRALDSEIRQLNKTMLATQDPRQKKQLQDRIKSKKEEMVSGNQHIEHLSSLNKRVDLAKRNLKTTGDIEGDDIMRYDTLGTDRQSGMRRSASRKPSKNKRAGMMRQMRYDNPQLYKQVRDYAKRQIGSDAVSDMPEH